MQRPQPRTDDERDELEEPERVPSLLSARELQAPVASDKNDDDHASPEERSEKKQRKTPASANQKRPRAR